MRSFQSLSEQEILALAISLEEEDARIYGDFAEGLNEVISWVRHRFMDTPLASAVFQVVIGGLLVFLTGVLIGSS
jgi:hypothetical protein